MPFVQGLEMRLKSTPKKIAAGTAKTSLRPVKHPVVTIIDYSLVTMVLRECSLATPRKW